MLFSFTSGVSLLPGNSILRLSPRSKAVCCTNYHISEIRISPRAVIVASGNP